MIAPLIKSLAKLNWRSNEITMEINGVINVYKERGYTSHDVVNILKRTLKTKAGHTGTLDPEAEGVLPIVLGKSTKLADYIMAEDKIYEAIIHFGVTTDTQDMTGNVITDNRPVSISKEQLLIALEKFRGEISQIPPMYSAIKIGGEKLYNLARKGIEVERKPRQVTIDDIELIEIGIETARILVKCSKGTYIRSLCADIGEALGSGAAMGDLLRRASGDFHLKDAIKIDDIKLLFDEGKIADYIIPPEAFFKKYPKAYAKPGANKFISNGNKFSAELIETEKLEKNQKCRLYVNDSQFVGLYILDESGILKPEIILIDLNKV